MHIPNIPLVLESCIPAITDDSLESAVAGESDNAHINEEDVVNDEEEAELELGIVSD